MKTRMCLIVIAVVMLLSVPAFAEEGFVGLVPMTVEGLYVAGTNLDVAAAAVLTRPHEVVDGGAHGIYIAGDAVIKTGCMLVDGCAQGLYVANTNLDVAVVALVTKPVETIWGGLKLLLSGADAIRKCAFGT